MYFHRCGYHIMYNNITSYSNNNIIIIHSYRNTLRRNAEDLRIAESFITENDRKPITYVYYVYRSDWTGKKIQVDFWCNSILLCSVVDRRGG